MLQTVLIPCSWLWRRLSPLLRGQEIDKSGCIMGFFMLQVLIGFNQGEATAGDPEGWGERAKVFMPLLPP